MASFDKYAPKLKKWEGGFGNHPADTGGATMCGVTLSTFRQFFGADKTEADLRKMTEAQWRTVMKGGFWDKCWADQIKNQSVAELIVDWCVNSGTGMIKRVQAIVTTTTDGVMGYTFLFTRSRVGSLSRHIARSRQSRYISLTVDFYLGHSARFMV